MRTPIVAIAARVVAIAIALAAVIDPSMATQRAVRPIVSVVASDASQQARAERLAQALRDRYTVLSAPVSSASGMVIVGNTIPNAASDFSAPVIVATSSPSNIALARVTAPTRAALETRIPVSATVRLSQRAAVRVHAQLRTRGRIVADTIVSVAANVAAHSIALSFAPTDTAITVVQLAVWLDGAARAASDTLRHDVAVDVHGTRHRVLFFDRRPSWMSTFVRRALERDPRFAVTSRVVTSVTSSTSVSRLAGAAPADLAGIAASTNEADAFDAVIVGAPDALTARDVDGLRTLLRERGASVLLLADHAAAGPVDALVASNGWRASARRTPAHVVSDDKGVSLLAGNLGAPASLPANAEVIAAVADSTNTSRPQPIVWQQPVALGTLVVSGAFDAWRYRDPAQSTFDNTWRDIVSNAIARRLAPIDVELSRTLVAPRASLSLRITPRDRNTTQRLSARVEPVGDTLTLVRDSASIGDVHAEFRAPTAAGRYRIVVRNADSRSSDSVVVPFAVADTVAADASGSTDVLALWTAAHSGTVINGDDTRAIIDDLARRITAPVRTAPWHPMRSPWWIVPFALLLSLEWWWRRRAGRN